MWDQYSRQYLWRRIYNQWSWRVAISYQRDTQRHGRSRTQNAWEANKSRHKARLTVCVCVCVCVEVKIMSCHIQIRLRYWCMSVFVWNLFHLKNPILIGQFCLILAAISKHAKQDQFIWCTSLYNILEGLEEQLMLLKKQLKKAKPKTV